MLGFFSEGLSQYRSIFLVLPHDAKQSHMGRSLDVRPLTQVLVLISPISKFSCVRSARNHGLCIIVHISSSSEVI